MKAVLCWAGFSGYMAACWKHLTRKKGLDLHILAWKPDSNAQFQDSLMEEIPHTLLDVDQRNDYSYICEQVIGHNPDIVYISGWMSHAYRSLTKESKLKNASFIMGMDTPWWGTMRQKLARYPLRSFINALSMIIVTGERSWQYARNLGAPVSSIRRGLYGVSHSDLSQALKSRLTGEWPKRFLFAGRFESEKAIDILVKAYHQYRQRVDDPWDLHCCGSGSQGHLLNEQPGIINQGFKQPGEMQDIWASSGAFVLPSRFDPWPLAIVEACAAGLPILASEQCGSTVECVRPLHNGFLFAANSTQALCNAFYDAHMSYKKLPDMGKASNAMASAYTSELWADRWYSWFNELMRNKNED